MCQKTEAPAQFYKIAVICHYTCANYSPNRYEHISTEMSTPQYHQQLRKRLANHGEPLSNADQKIGRLDRLTFIVGVLGPISTVPQVFTVFVHRNAAGVSAISWSLYVLFDIVWLTYGIVHKERAIIVTYSLCIVINGLVALGAILY
jgi:uncharacterized protein with PQ loop repeat